MYKKRKGCVTTLLFIAGFLALCACRHVAPQHHLAVDDIHQTLAESSAIDRSLAKKAKHKIPGTVNAALLPEYRGNGSHYHESRRFNIAVQEVPAKTFFNGLVKGTPYNMVVAQNVQGAISLNLKNVTVEEVLMTLQNLYGYEFKRTPSGFMVLPNGLHTQIFKLNYLNMSRTGETETSVSSGQPSMSGSSSTSNTNFTAVNNATSAQRSSTVKTKSESGFWKSIDNTLQALIGTEEGRSVIIQPDAGAIVVRADSSQLRQVREYLAAIQRSMNRQVIIEAKILEVQLNDRFQSGLNWQLLGLQQGGVYTGATSDFADNIFTLKSSAGGAFSSMIKLLAQEGNVQVLSSPRIATVNNQKAVIKVGSDEYFVTGVSTSTLAGTGATDTSQNVNMTPFFSGIALDVTPEIDEQDNVILHIHPSVSDVQQKDKVVTIGSKVVTLPSAASSVRESDSIIRASNGQVVVIGGLMTNSSSEKLNAAPALGQAPIIGPLFRDTKQQSTKSELVILLRPLVVGPKTWHRDIDKTEQRYQNLDRGFHAGSKQDVFGNLGEPDLTCNTSISDCG